MFSSRILRAAQQTAKNASNPNQTVGKILAGLATLGFAYPIFFHQPPHTQTRSELGIQDSVAGSGSSAAEASGDE